jgi:hypothetical protein
MHMFRPFAWISESRISDKVNGEADFKLASATRPVMEILPGCSTVKRKRDSEEILDVKMDVRTEGLPEAKRAKTSEEPENITRTASVVEEEKEITAIAVDQVRETVEAQFSLEILLKHEELRLINQELAKCQVAFEQLRRCHLIPYPLSQGTPESMLNISNGTGPALRQADHVPQWAAPYGVTDGPYTKHYAKWLIPDASFDGEQYDGSVTSRASKSTLIEGRSTRNSIAEASTPLSGLKARGQRGSTGQKLQALSSGYPGAKATGPSFVKRKDGQLVKLVCINCNREDFSSTQGFINHVRIAHKIEYKSHEEAAIACGQPVETDEHSAHSAVSEVHTPAPANGLVHPLIRSAPTDREAYVSLLHHINTSLSLFQQGKLPGVTSIPGSAVSTPLKPKFLEPTTEASPHQDFVPSTSTPHLSALMRNKGFGGNLTDIVGDAKQTVDFDELSYDEESDIEQSPQQHIGGLDGAASPPIMRVPARAIMSAAPFKRPVSSKGIEGNMRKPGISPRMGLSTPFIDTAAAANHNKPSTRLLNSHDFDHHDVDSDLDMMGPSLIDLSPNTVASNNAPSLVSDDGEYDEGDDAESQVSDNEDEDSDVAEIDIEDCEVEKVVPRVRSESSSGRKEGKHVTFVTPVKEKERPHSRT